MADVLDQFNAPPRPAPKPPAAVPPSTTATPSGPDAAASGSSTVLPDVLSEDFAAELAAGMEALMRDLGKPSSSSEDAAAREAWEKMLIAGMEEATKGGIDMFGAPDFPATGTAPARPAPTEAPPENVDEFQRKILEAMQKLKTSEDNIQVSTKDI